MIKIFAFPSFTDIDKTTGKVRQSGVDYVRMKLPMTELAKQKGFKVTIYSPEQSMKWDDVAKDNDILYFNYLNNPTGFAIMGCMARKNGRKLVMDLDDNIWKILPDNLAYKVWQPGGQAIKDITSIANEVDYITCTNQYLKNAILSKTNKKPEEVFVLPNRIDIDNVYTYRRPEKNSNQIVIGHFGSTTHFNSILDREFVMGMDKIMQNYPNVTFKTIGSFFSGFKEKWGLRYREGLGDPDLFTWINKRVPVEMAEVDFVAIPIADNVYNRCKSSIKYLEVSSMKIPGCWQDIRQYREVVKDGYNGYLCKTAKDWYKKMKKLIDDKQSRDKMAEAAFKTIEEDWQMKSNVDLYIDLFKKIV